MIDPNLAILTWLKSSPELVALVGTNFYSPVLPEGFSANDAPQPNSATRAVVVRKLGGTSQPEIPTVIDPRFAIEFWALEAPDATQMYGVARDLMHGATSIDLGDAGFVITSQEEVPGQDVTDPETHWAMVFAYYHVKLRSSVAPSSPVTPVQFIGSDMPSKSFHWIAQGGMNDARQIKASPGVVTSVSAFSPPTGKSTVYIKFFDQIAAPNPTGGDVPLKTIGVELGVAADPQLPYGGIEFQHGIWMLITKNMADNDATPVVAGDVAVDVGWQ